MEHFAQYSHAMLSIVIWALIVLILSPLSAATKQKTSATPGSSVVPDYSDKAYRLDRAYHNGVETLCVFGLVTIVAIMAGASPFWINLLAAIALILRIAMVYVHVQGIGKPGGGPRTIFYVLGWVVHIVIAVFAIVAIL